MNRFKVTDIVGDVVARHPTLAHVFEQARIDYCCGGQKTLETACQEKGLDSGTFLNALEEAVSASAAERVFDPAAVSLTELADHIVETHHHYLKSERPRLNSMTEKVASVHGEKDARLKTVRETFLALAEELSNHMMKEEGILFPMIRQLDASDEAPTFHCGTLANPIRQMETEHDHAGAALRRLRELTDGFTAPDWACNTYRVLLDALHQLERDLHQHIHKENNVLFPRALAMERRKGAAP